MAETGSTEKMADEAMSGLRELLGATREDHVKRVAPLYEKLRGPPADYVDREYARSIRRQIAQFEQSQRDIERPIIDQMVKIESMRLRPLIISRTDMPKDFPHG